MLRPTPLRRNESRVTVENVAKLPEISVDSRAILPRS